MDALRKLSSLGRNRDSSTKAESSSPKVEPKVEEPKSSREEEEDDEPKTPALTPIRVRGSRDDDEEESVGSADSFDSALERMAASSITSFEPPSPVGSVGHGHHFERGSVEGLPQQGNNSYDDSYDDEDESEEEEETTTSGSSSEYSSSASNTEDEVDTTSVRARSEDHGEYEDEFEEAYDGGVDSDNAARKSRESEAGVSRSQNAAASTSTENDDEEGFVVKVPVTESKYEVYEDTLEDHEEEERIIKVAGERSEEDSEEEDEVDPRVIIKKELPRDVAQDRRLLGPEAPTGGVERQPSSISLTRAGYSGGSDADAEDEYYEYDGEEDESEDDEDGGAQAAGRSGTGMESANKPSLGASGPSLPTLPNRPTRKPTAAATDRDTDTAGRTMQQRESSPTQVVASTTTTTIDVETTNNNESNETREKLQSIRVKFLRLAHRLGHSPQNQIVAQVLYRLGLAESLRGGGTSNRTGAFGFDRANSLALEAEALHQDEELDFECTILVLGKTGVGKSATINSIFDERKSVTSAFYPSTSKVREIAGTVQGMKMRVIDTPGLLPSPTEQRHNEKIMGQVKRYTKRCPPDIVLYFDRLDMQSRDLGDVSMLRTITDVFGAAVWFNAIVVLTHAGSAPPDGPNGAALSYDMFVTQRTHIVQHMIRQAAGDMRLTNPVSLVENHPACRTNRSGQRVLPNGQIWKNHLLLLCFASKILVEANTLLKLFETATVGGKPFGQRPRVPPLPFLLSSLLQSRSQLRMPNEQQGESDDESDESDDDEDDVNEYDYLPPFRPLSREELEELTKEQRQQYAEELADRERLFQKKEYREQIKRRREMKRRAAAKPNNELPEAGEEDAGQAASVPVPMPDMALPPSFDSDNPTHRYRYLETANQWLVRPVLDTHGWDHDAGYDGLNVEKMFVVKENIPASITGQVTKDKKEAQVHLEAAASLRHGEGKVTLTGFEVQTIGKDLGYTLRAETRFTNFRRNKTTAGLTCTVLKDTIAAGLKLEDSILIGKRVKMVVNGGVLTGKGDKAFGGSLEATLRGKDYPFSQTLSTLGLSVMDWHGDLAIGGNLQSQFMVGKTLLVSRANLNNRGSGQITIRASSSEQLQMVLVAIVPILRSLINLRFGRGDQPSH